MKYRIYYSHCGDAPTTEIVNCVTDEAAKTLLDQKRADPTNAMDNLWMERIDVEEKVTHIN